MCGSVYPTAAPMVTAYLGCAGSAHSVEAVNVPFKTVIAQLPVGSTTATDNYMAISSDGTKIAYANSVENTVTVIDPTTYATTSVSGFTTPAGLAFKPGSSEVWVPNSDSSTNTISVLDTNTNTITQEINFVFAGPTSIAFLPDATKAFVSCSQGSTVYLYKTADYSQVTSFTLTGVIGPDQVVINPVLISGVRYGYVTSSSQSVLAVFNADATSPSFVGTITMPTTTRYLAITPDGSTVCVTGANGLYLVNTATQVVTSSITGGSFSNAQGVAITPDGTTAYVVNQDNATISIVDIASATQTGTISQNVFTSPRSIAIGSTPHLNTGLVTGVINLSTASTAVTASATNNTTATVYMDLAAYQVHTLPPASGWVSTQTTLADDPKSIAASGGTQTFSITTTGFTGDVVQFDLYQTSNQVSLSGVVTPYVSNDQINILSAYMLSY